MPDGECTEASSAETWTLCAGASRARRARVEGPGLLDQRTLPAAAEPAETDLHLTGPEWTLFESNTGFDFYSHILLLCGCVCLCVCEHT